MFKFAKKQEETSEPILEEVTEEQLSQVTGGANGSGVFGLLDTATGLTGTVTGLTTPLLNGVSVSPLQIQVGGITVSTPEITPTSLLP
jgi:bacteriocin-like protein